ncbi:MAG: hypothetical protein EZS28_005483 [Streblomastix strix]|uniref:Protein kinase domain-containing protein n=1 Tax=Streblomastix strix TaxID=222440 RepID=A0A5J4WVB2_9EUKA|nr:MAG: hypothetical protein EZS28_005483 [Streblomastix strix]
MQIIREQLEFQNPIYIGEGNYGRVYSAKDTNGTYFAIKVQNKQEYYDKEFAAAGNLQQIPSNYFVKTFGQKKIDDRVFLAMEFCNMGGLDVTFIKALIPRASILTGIIPKLCGFGEIRNIQNIRNADAFSGTPFFFPPEIGESRKNYNQGVDIWMLGLTLYMLATGKLVDSPSYEVLRTLGFVLPPELAEFSNTDQNEVLLDRNGKKLSETMGKEFVQLLSRMLTYEPSQRYTAAQLLQLSIFTNRRAGNLEIIPNAYAEELGFSVQSQLNGWVGSAKVIPMQQRNDTEFKMLQQIQHPFIIPYLGLQQSNDHVVVYTELADYYSLADLLSGQQITEPVVKLISWEILLALQRIHRQGFIHGNLKLDNILFCTNPNTKGIDVQLCNFSLGRQIGEKVIIKENGLNYMGLYYAPEALNANAVADPRMDMFSFGLVLYTMLTRNHPLIGLTLAEYFSQVKQFFDQVPLFHIDEHISSEAADLVTLLLVPQISQRITVVQALQSPFFPQEWRSLLQPEGDWLKWRANGHQPLPKELYDYAFGEGNSLANRIKLLPGYIAPHSLQGSSIEFDMNTYLTMADRGEDIQPNTISKISGTIANWNDYEPHIKGQFWYFWLKPTQKYRTETPICLAIDENNPAFEMLKSAVETNSNQEFQMISFTEYLNNVSESVGKNVHVVPDSEEDNQLKMQVGLDINVELICVICEFQQDYHWFKLETIINQKELTSGATNKINHKISIAKKTQKQPISKPVSKQPVSKPVSKQPVSKPVSKQPISKPVSKQPISKPVSNQPISKPVSKQTTSKPVPKQPISKPVSKQPTSKPVSKQSVSKPVSKQPTSQPVRK